MPFRPRPGHPYTAGAPLAIAHRGGARLAPENTMPAFRQAIDVYDVDMLEMDVRATRDGRIVVIHDSTVDRTCSGVGPVRTMDYAELARLDAGHHFLDLNGEPSFRGKGVAVPLFEEVLEAFPRMRLNVECKSADAAEALVRLIRRHGAEDRVLVAAEFERNRWAVRGYEGPWGASALQLRAFWLTHRLPPAFRYAPRADALQIPDRWAGRQVATRQVIRAAHGLNLPVHVWVVDEADRMRELLSWGVDGIQSDRLDVLSQVFEEPLHRQATAVH